MRRFKIIDWIIVMSLQSLQYRPTETAIGIKYGRRHKIRESYFLSAKSFWKRHYMIHTVSYPRI